MTVKELIEKLQKMPQEADVRMCPPDDGWSPIVEVRIYNNSTVDLLAEGH